MPPRAKPKQPVVLWVMFVVLFIGVVGLISFALSQHKSLSISSLLPRSEKTLPGYYRVTHVYDGDTIEIDMNGTAEKVRFIGVDTPETHHPSKPVQCYGPEASAYTTAQLTDRQVRLEVDPTNQNRDRYGRLLRYVYLPDGTLYNQRLVTLGYGFAYTVFPFQKTKDFLGSEQTAEQSKLGLWANCQVNYASGSPQTNTEK